VILTALLCLNVHAEEKVSDDALVQAAEKLVATDAAANKEATASTVKSTETSTSATTATAAPVANDLSKENEIPVFLDNSKKADKGFGAVMWRLLASLALIGVVGGGLIYASRRWTRQKDKGGSKARIEMLHQFHLGPRKSLALVRVSGEVSLIGITDHSINMIKTVTLIDDELEGVLGKDFNNFLEDEFSMEDVRTALGARV
jgi:flagellar protein FliO/FliZ